MSANAEGESGDRKSLVDLAVKFLNNPRILDKPKEAKVAFLKKKGLTDKEIETALTQAEQVATKTVSLPPPRPVPVQVSREYTWRQIAVGSVFIGGCVGVVIYWIKKFLKSWYSGQNRQEERLVSLENVVQGMQTSNEASMRELHESTETIKQILETQQTQLTNLSTNRLATEQSFKTIQTDISSLKGLLLNRHQFPSLQRSPGSSSGGSGSIPDWQRPPTTVPSPESDNHDTVTVSNEPD